MKNTIRTKIIGISSFAAVIVILLAGLLLVGCPDTEEEEKLTVNFAYIPGIPVPAIGETPVWAITPTPQYTGTVRWEGAMSGDGRFIAGQIYTAAITLTAVGNYTLEGVPADFFKVAGADRVIYAANSNTVIVIFPRTSVTIVNIAAISGVTAPVTGGRPVTAITPTVQYTGNVTWTKADGTSFTGNFASGTAYTATITLTTTSGYILDGVAQNFFTVEGATSVSNAANSGVITARFPAALTTISIKDIEGVPAPEMGKAAVKTITANDQYTGTVTWKSAAGATLSGNFAAGTVYTATITLTAKSGYTFQGVRANSFTVDWARSVTNAADSGIITATFPSTVATINLKAIPGVTPPSVGANPVKAITPTDQYTGTVTWNIQGDTSPFTGPFVGGKTYTATITLKPQDGYTLTGVSKDFFTVDGTAAKPTNVAGSGVVTATFLKIVEKTPITGIAPEAGVSALTSIPTTSATSSQYSGKITWTTEKGAPHTGRFAEATAYTATITLKAATGYTLQGVTANYFTVALATSTTNTASNPDVITVKFPSTGNTSSSTKRTTVNIQNVTFESDNQPASGKLIKDAKVAETLQYTGSVTWNPSPTANDKFSITQRIEATITLQAKDGFTFAGVAQNYFTVEGQVRGNTTNEAGPTAVPTNIVDDKISIYIIPFNPFEGEVTDTTIMGIPAPTFTVLTPGTGNGGQVIRSVITSDQYTVSVKWYEKGSSNVFGKDTFDPATAYKAVITLDTKSGYTFKGVNKNDFKVAGAPTTGWDPTTSSVTVDDPASNGASMVITVEYNETNGYTITDRYIDIAYPKAGVTPSTTPYTSTNNQFTAIKEWTTSSPFEAGKIYGAKITVTPKNGYTLKTVTGNFFEVWTTTTPPPGLTLTQEAGSGVINVTFPRTESFPPILSITLAAPVAGGTPVSTVSGTGYTGTVDWGVSSLINFAAGTQYTATITLTPDTSNGYTLYGIPANSFLVPGATASNSANSNIVRATFPRTDTTVSLKAITGITAPVAGADAVTTIDTAQYTGTVTWIPTLPTTGLSTGKFAAGTTYTATIDLTVKSGYTLYNVGITGWTVQGVSTTLATVTYTATDTTTYASGRITGATFPKTADTVTALTINVTAPANGQSPVTTPITATGQYTGTVAWKDETGASFNGKFETGKKYTVEITLNVLTGYTLYGLTTNAFTINSSYNYATLTGNKVTYTFTSL